MRPSVQKYPPEQSGSFSHAACHHSSLEALALGTPVIGVPQAGGLGEVAKQAAPGAVTLADPGPEFINSMARTEQKSLDRLKPSLLPSGYSLNCVIQEFEKILEN